MKAKPTPPAAPDKWEENPLEWPLASGHGDRLIAALDVRMKRQRRRRMAAGVAAGLSLACVWFFGAALPHGAKNSPRTDSRAVVVGPERRNLPDGSIVDLKPGAELVVNFTAGFTGTRHVVLARGEAHFQVAKNPDRPFVVSAGSVDFRAVGTAFLVGVDAAAVEMLVTEGRVTVETPAHAAAVLKSVSTVDAGSRVVVQTATQQPPEITTVSADDTRERLAWRVPRLEFSETPLTEVVRLLNQHSGSRISLASSDLGRVEISGAIRADNLESLLGILQTTYSIEVIRLPTGEIILKAGR